MRKLAYAGVFASLLAIVACGPYTTRPANDEAAANGESPAPSAGNGPGESRELSRVGLVPGEQVAFAISDLAQRTGLAEKAITVKEARSVTWGSAAVGCPREGMSYTQAIVPGVLLLLEASGTIFRYHGREGRQPFYCPDERADEPAYGPGKEFM
jgi:hypothetical protein